jgi:serine/threonine protein kinase
MDDNPSEFTYTLQEFHSIRRAPNEDLSFSIRLLDKTLTYYSEFPDITFEWFSKIEHSLEYYHISPKDKDVRSFKQSDDSRTHTSGLSDLSEEQSSEVLIDLDSFIKLDNIGAGGFGSVFKVMKKDSEEVFAMKELNKNKLRNNKVIKYAWSECKTLKSMNHPFIISLEWCFQTNSSICLIMEYCPFGDFEPVLDHFKKLDEKVAKFYIAETILAIEYLHTKNIVYRDLKPSNILLDKEGHIKLADFGLAKENVTEKNPAISFCGTPAYLPPEILNNTGAYTATDIYLLGVNLFKFLTGNTPFYEKLSSLHDLYKAISQSSIVFPEEVKSNARNLISAMMNKKPELRPSISQVKKHKFFSDVNWEHVIEKRTKPPISVEELSNIINRGCNFEFVGF